jgi:Spy/CpxP family protein refolding chaperone
MNRMMIPLMLLLGGAPALAQPVANARIEARHEMGEKRLERMTARLGLDAESAARVRATFEKYRAELAPVRQTLWTTRTALKAELAAPQPDSAKLSQLTDQLASARSDMQAIHARKIAELKSELTPRQFAELVVARQGRGMHGHGRGRFERSRTEQE